jgi:hypothetical protein
MNLYSYLSKHDAKVRSGGAELIRLANACNVTPYYVYLVALGHKRVSETTAACMAANSIGGELDAGEVNHNNARRKDGMQPIKAERAEKGNNQFG